MRSALPILALAFLLAGGVYYLLEGGAPAPVEDFDDGGDDQLTDEERERVLLEGDPQAAARIKAAREARERAKAETDARDRALVQAQPKVFLVGRVVDASNDQPIVGAYAWLESAEQPCPRLPRRVLLVLNDNVTGNSVSLPPSGAMQGGAAGIPPPRTPHATERSDKDGRFSMAARGDIDHTKLTGGFDLFVMADGYVATMVCALPNGRDVEVRLQRGHTIRGTVRNVFNRPVSGVEIMASPVGETPRQLGHFAQGTTDQQGGFELTGLVAGEVVVETRHPNYMPRKMGPLDPKNTRTLDIQLVSALLVTFEIETVDGKPPNNASVEWRTAGKPPHTGLQLLRLADARKSGPPTDSETGTWKTDPIAVPCDHPEISFTVKADGHGAWRGQPMLLPQEGGEKTVPVALLPDTSQGRVRVRFESEGGEAVPYTQLKATERIMVRGQQKVEGGLVKQIGTEFQLTAVPPGPYAVIFRMPEYAPARVDFDARAGEETALTVTLHDAAKLRIRFTAAEPIMVGFRIRKDNQIVPAFLEDGTNAAVDPNADPDDAHAPKAEASDDGTLFTGFAGGDHVIEVTDPKLRAQRTRVTLIEGDEVEVEIRVTRR